MTETRAPTWYVYLLECADQSLYTGIAKHLEERIAKHKLGRGAKYTRSRLPVELVYSEPASDRSSALKRELELKRLSAADKRRLIGASGL